MKSSNTLLLIVMLFSLQVGAKNYQFIVGTYTSTSFSQGIYQLKINAENLNTDTMLLAKATNPNFLSFSKDKKYVYTINTEKNKSSVVSYDFSNKNQLTPINDADALAGKGPCHIASTALHVAIANYSGGSIYVFKLNSDNSLGQRVQEIQLTGSSINPARQAAPHTHQVVFSPDGKFLLVNDLGIDKVLVYSYNAANSNQPLSLFTELNVKPGSGPRHLTFDKKGKFIYLIQELDGTLSTLSFNKGKLETIHTTSVVRKTNLETGAADIHISPDGKFVYATNRGTINDITCFRTSANGALTFVQQVSTEGLHPRNFVISNDGKLLLVGNMRSNEITIFKRNLKTGELTFSGKKIKLGAPSCLLEY